MEIRKQNLLLVSVGLLMLGSCRNDPELPGSLGIGNAPRLIAEVESRTTTKSGVVENNSNYRTEERLRWDLGDRAIVQFYQENELKHSVDYKVTAVDKTYSNKCTFDVEGNQQMIAEGKYTLHGFFPKEGWNTLNRSVSMPFEQKQEGSSSKHIAGYFFMKAKVDNVAISDGNKDNAIAIHYQHLTSLIRYQVFNETGNRSLKVSKVVLSTSNDYFGTNAELINNDAVSLTVTTNVKKVSLDIHNGTFDDQSQFSAFMLLLPTSSKPNDLIVTLTFDDNGRTIEKMFALNGPQLDILQRGFRQGKGYSFILRVSPVGMNAEIVDWSEGDFNGSGLLPFEIETVRILRGEFLMGSSDGSNIGDVDGSGLNTTSAEPNRESKEVQHKVILTKDFYMSRYLITNEQYADFLNMNKIGKDGIWNAWSDTENREEVLIYDSKTEEAIYYNWGLNWDNTDGKWVPVSKCKSHPVIYVTWYGAKAFADWVGGSLPTEAQWEYACRAGTTTSYSFGDDATKLIEYGWCAENNDNQNYGTKQVGTKLPNPWGLDDIHGNVSEWCKDWYASYDIENTTDPSGPDKRSYHILRGGFWNGGVEYARSASRNFNLPDARAKNKGFRVIFNER